MRTSLACTVLGLGLALVSCGGGGGAAAVAANSPGVPDASAGGSGAAAAPTPVAARNIATWGDSLTYLCTPALQQAFPDREVSNGGVSGQTSAQILARFSADTATKSWINIFWYGHNDPNKQDSVNNVAASVAGLAPGNNEFVVMSMLTWAGTGYLGTQEYADTIAANASFASTYGANALDIRSWLVSLYDPNNPQDVADHALDLVPSSLRIDSIHLNAAGCSAVAGKLREFILAKGW